VLLLLLLLPFLAAMAAGIDAAFEPSSEQAAGQVDVLVLGAGIAGLAAAASLRAHGLSVFILEGRDRIGGAITLLHEYRTALTITAVLQGSCVLLLAGSTHTWCTWPT
jgi:NADPH-dependent 2,4-dienoyl-CoA reductase/sulfur reductase-like enzyme